MVGNLVISVVDAVMIGCTNQGRKTRVLGGITKYRRMYNVIIEVPRETSPLCSIIFNNFITLNF